MIEVVGDLWIYPAEWRCVTTNGVVKSDGRLVMGAGCALEAKQKYPEIDARLGKLVSLSGNQPYMLHDYKIISFPTKNHWKHPSDMSLIENSARSLVTFVREWDIKSVIIPRPGCGVGGLSWDNVKLALAKYFDSDMYIIVSNGNSRFESPYNQGLESAVYNNPFPPYSDAWWEYDSGFKDKK